MPPQKIQGLAEASGRRRPGSAHACTYFHAIFAVCFWAHYRWVTWRSHHLLAMQLRILLKKISLLLGFQMFVWLAFSDYRFVKKWLDCFGQNRHEVVGICGIVFVWESIGWVLCGKRDGGRSEYACRITTLCLESSYVIRQGQKYRRRIVNSCQSCSFEFFFL